MMGHCAMQAQWNRKYAITMTLNVSGFFLSLIYNFYTFNNINIYLSPTVFTEALLNPFPNKPWFLRVCSTCLLKTLWEKEKLLVTSNFSFTHSAFYPFSELFAIFIKLEIVVCRLFQLGRVSNLSFGKELRVINPTNKHCFSQ